MPRGWISPPECEVVEGELLDSDVDEGSGDEDESAGMLAAERRRERRAEQKRVGESVELGFGVWGRLLGSGSGTTPPASVEGRDSSGREIPVAERAPVSKRRGSAPGS